MPLKHITINVINLILSDTKLITIMKIEKYIILLLNVILFEINLLLFIIMTITEAQTAI